MRRSARSFRGQVRPQFRCNACFDDAGSPKPSVGPLVRSEPAAAAEGRAASPIAQRNDECLERKVTSSEHSDENKGCFNDDVLVLCRCLIGPVDPAEDRVVQRINRIRQLSSKESQGSQFARQADLRSRICEQWRNHCAGVLAAVAV
jgi:hypothetical protein